MNWDNYLNKPEDWVDPNVVFWKSKDLSKIRRYTSADGYQFWLDPPHDTIQTDLPGVRMTFHMLYGHGYVGHSFAKLHFDGSYVVLTKNTAKQGRIAFLPTPSERNDNDAQVWHVDDLFQSFEVADNENYPWIDLAMLIPRVSVLGMRNFSNVEQQSKCLRLIETLLSCHDGSMLNAIDGRKTCGQVVFGDELIGKVNSGKLIG